MSSKILKNANSKESTSAVLAAAAQFDMAKSHNQTYMPMKTPEKPPVSRYQEEGDGEP